MYSETHRTSMYLVGFENLHFYQDKKHFHHPESFLTFFHSHSSQKQPLISLAVPLMNVAID